MTEYRIVRDNYCGFEVQSRRWWWPFWVECNFSNTHDTLKEAEYFIRVRMSPVVKHVRSLDDLTQSQE